MGAVQQVIGIHEMSAQLGELSLLVGRKALKEFLAGDELQDSVAEKLQLLVVRRRGQALAGVRAVRQRLLHQCAICELVAQRLFEIVERLMFHTILFENVKERGSSVSLP